MTNTDLAYRPQVIVARRVREERQRLGWSQKDLAGRLHELGWYDKGDQQPTIARIESGKRAVPIDELFALAAALETSPVYLLTPLDDDELVAVTPSKTIPANAARAWLRGYPVPISPTIDLAALPRSELRQLVARAVDRKLSRPIGPLVRMVVDHERRKAFIDETTNAILEGPDREEALSG